MGWTLLRSERFAGVVRVVRASKSDGLQQIEQLAPVGALELGVGVEVAQNHGRPAPNPIGVALNPHMCLAIRCCTRPCLPRPDRDHLEIEIAVFRPKSAKAVHRVGKVCELKRRFGVGEHPNAPLGEGGFRASVPIRWLALAVEYSSRVDRFDLLDGQYVGAEGGHALRLLPEPTDATVPGDQAHEFTIMDGITLQSGSSEYDAALHAALPARVPSGCGLSPVCPRRGSAGGPHSGSLPRGARATV